MIKYILCSFSLKKVGLTRWCVNICKTLNCVYIYDKNIHFHFLLNKAFNINSWKTLTVDSTWNSTYRLIFILSGELASEAVHAGASDPRATGQPEKGFFHHGATECCPHHGLRVDTVLSRVKHQDSVSSLHCPLPAQITWAWIPVLLDWHNGIISTNKHVSTVI